MWDGEYKFLDDKFATENVKKQYGALADTSLSCAERHRKTGKEFWESIVGCNCLYNNMLSIIPKKNLVSNMGLTQDSVHSNTSKKYLSKVTSNLFEMKTYELEFPMKHPDYVIENKAYRKRVNIIMGIGHPLRVKWRRLVYILKKFL